MGWRWRSGEENRLCLIGKSHLLGGFEKLRNGLKRCSEDRRHCFTTLLVFFLPCHELFAFDFRFADERLNFAQTLPCEFDILLDRNGFGGKVGKLLSEMGDFVVRSAMRSVSGAIFG